MDLKEKLEDEIKTLKEELDSYESSDENQYYYLLGAYETLNKLLDND